MLYARFHSMVTAERPLSEVVYEAVTQTYAEVFGEENSKLLTPTYLPNLLVEHPKGEQQDYLEKLLGPECLALHNSDELAWFLTDVLNTPLRLRMENARYGQMQEHVDSFTLFLGMPKKAASFRNWGWSSSYYGEALKKALETMPGLASEYRRDWEFRLARDLGESFGKLLWPDGEHSKAHKESVRDVSDAAGWVVLDDLMRQRKSEGNPLIPVVNMRLAGFQPIGLKIQLFPGFYMLDSDGKADSHFQLVAPKTSFSI